MRLRLIFVMVAALLATCLFTADLSASNEKLITLVDNGKSDYRIVVAKGALKTPVFAAKELQVYIRKVTGAALDISQTPNSNGKNILIGPSDYTKALGVSLDDVAPEGFIVKTVGDTLIIMGRDTKGKPLNAHWRSAPQTGTLFGVYDFIEKFLGVRWFMPGDVGEYYPEKATVKLHNINIKDGPSFISRVLYVPNKNSEASKLWLRRHKIGRSLVVQHSHNWYYLIPCFPSPKGWSVWEKKRYPFKDHPEYYALVDGRRIMTHNVAVGALHNGQICTSNKDVQRICAETALEWYKEKPDVPMMSLSANDGGGYCECKNCRALDVEAWPGDNSYMSDRIMSFYNGVAELVAPNAPDKYLGAYCYGNYTNPPKRTKPHKNLCLWDVHNGNLFHFTPETRKERRKRIRDWGNIHSNMFYYTAYNGNGFWNFPTSTRRHLADLIKFTKECGYKGHHDYGFGCWGGGALELIIAAKGMWNADFDVEAVLDDHYDTCYGKKAGEMIRQYHKLIEKQTRLFAEKNKQKLSSIDTLGVLNISAIDKIRPYYAGIRDQSRALLNEAVKLAPEGNQKKRAELVSTNFRLVELTLDTLDAYDDVKNNLSLETAMVFKKAVDKREEFLEVYKDSPAISYGVVRGDDAKYNLPVTTVMADYFLATKGKKRSLECALTDKPVVIDGKLNEASWQEAVAVSDFVKKDDAAPAEFKSTARILRDDKNLYIGLECIDPAADKLLENTSKRDGAVWRDNEVELFFDPGRNGKKVYQLIFNSAGTQFDLLHQNGKGDAKWNGNWIVAITKEKGRWFAEVKIPLRELGNPLPGDIWGINICRVRKTADGGKVEYSQVTPTFGLFMKPEKFADLIMR